MNDHELSVTGWVLIDAMKYEAIAFKIWCNKNEDAINFREEHTHTPEQLYELFKNEKG